MGDVLRGVEHSRTLWNEPNVLRQHAGDATSAGEQERRQRRCIDRVLDVHDVGRAEAPTE